MDSQKIKRALQEGNLKYRIVTEILNLFGYSNRNIAGLEIKNKVYQYLDKNYSRKIGEFLYKKAEECDASGDKYIWICWFQGMENAPELVKRCYASVKRNMRSTYYAQNQRKQESRQDRPLMHRLQSCRRTKLS